MAGTKASKNETSFKPGNNANPKGAPVKEMRVADWIKHELDKEDIDVSTREGYEKAVSMRRILAKKLVDTAITHEDAKIRLDYSKEVLDRTEGKPHQTTDITSDGEKIQNVLFVKPEKLADESD